MYKRQGLIGASAGYGMWLGALEAPSSSLSEFDEAMVRFGDRLKATRPTAKNLARACLLYTSMRNFVLRRGKEFSRRKVGLKDGPFGSGPLPEEFYGHQRHHAPLCRSTGIKMLFDADEGQKSRGVNIL